MARFKKTASYAAEGGTGHIDEYVLELRPGHTITRRDHTTRLGAGRKGGAASVDVHRTLTCSCGGHLGFGGLTVAEDLAHLRHFDSDAEREAYEADQAAKRARIIESLGLSA